MFIYIIYVCVYIYIYVYIFTYVHTYIYICTYRNCISGLPTSIVDYKRTTTTTTILWRLQCRHLKIGSVLQCVAVCCRVLHCVAVCCSALQCVAVDYKKTTTTTTIFLKLQCMMYISLWVPAQRHLNASASHSPFRHTPLTLTRDMLTHLTLTHRRRLKDWAVGSICACVVRRWRLRVAHFV